MVVWVVWLCMWFHICFEASLVVFVVPGFLFFNLCHVCDCCGKWHCVAVAFSMTDGMNLYN